ncbi:Mandelate racemase / muconate lactonizing enzyme, N-terminal domain [Devosia enhydra]|uniref:Mandelate racemase / muconate lactonizing enzyme, N-terminal domain n=1 Tax=Devosia enhydra TaxID=665118 RepID=A0A1K2HZR0_9HYPH|nr:mandelate racemase/muconate lactonizing enzyme family protein [Devosia enhydra]SFZ85419.1 Mandelate racemase / muconate lactonizing enzyme, N-terminal domain [Devosia enhydra]
MRLTRLTAIPLQARFADIYGGADKVPAHIRAPAAHFQRIPRTGQFATLVVAESDDGVVGYGECFGLPHPLAAASLLTHVVAPAMIGEDIGDPAAMTSALHDYFFAMGHTRGPAMEALSGVDIALWDLKARAAGVPLATLLGSSPGPVPTYVSPIAFRATPAETAADASSYLDQGYRAFKLKIGRGIATDLAHIEAARSALGSLPLYLDVNCGYDVPTAIALARALPRFDIGWLEEPIPPDDPEALAEVRRASPVPIAAGENEFAMGAYRALVRAGAVDILQCNIGRCGGVSGLLAVGELCHASGLTMAPHGVGASVAVAASVHAGRAARGFHSYEANRLPNPMRDEMGVTPTALVDGCLVAADRPGHGGEPDMQKLQRYRLDIQSGG